VSREGRVREQCCRKHGPMFQAVGEKVKRFRIKKNRGRRFSLEMGGKGGKIKEVGDVQKEMVGTHSPNQRNAVLAKGGGFNEGRRGSNRDTGQ